jgi:Superinfection exclusion gene product 17
VSRKAKDEANEGDLRVWHIPQVPMKPFHVAVRNIREADLILETLAFYDIFQFKNKIKPDYSNAAGLEVFKEGEWEDWYDEESGDSYDDLRLRNPERLKELTA